MCEGTNPFPEPMLTKQQWGLVAFILGNFSGNAQDMVTWWCHQMETFSVLLAINAWNSPVTSEFPTQRRVMRSFDVSLIYAWINGWVNNREAGDFRHCWHPLWCHCNEYENYRFYWWHWSEWYLTTPSHYLNLGWLVISKAKWHSSEGIIIKRFENTSQFIKVENCIF